jgi:hypothetical protein
VEDNLGDLEVGGRTKLKSVPKEIEDYELLKEKSVQWS